MKKNAITIGMAILAALLMLGTPAEAQSRKLKKAAQKEAKRLEKEGYRTMLLPLEQQLEEFYVRQMEKDRDGMPVWLAQAGEAKGGTYATAQLEAITIAKTRLAGQLQTQVMSEAKSSLANETITGEESVSITKVLEKSTQLVAQRMSKVVVAQEYYRVLNDNRCEVKVVILYNIALMREAMILDAREVMKEEFKNAKPEIEKIVENIINEGVRGDN